MNWIKKLMKISIKEKINKKIKTIEIIDGFFIKATKNTPEINFKNNGECYIKGLSIPENLDELYREAKNFLNDLISKNIVINLTFNYSYFNTLTQRYNYELLEVLNKQKIKGNVIWQYLDIDEDGADMGEMYKLAFPDLNIKLKNNG